MQSTSLLQIMPRLMVEVIVIVVGVLLALWVDAFWEERMDRRKERVALFVRFSLAMGFFEDFCSSELSKLMKSLLTMTKYQNPLDIFWLRLILQRNDYTWPTPAGRTR